MYSWSAVALVTLFWTIILGEEWWLTWDKGLKLLLYFCPEDWGLLHILQTVILFVHPTVCAFHFCRRWLMFIFFIPSTLQLFLSRTFPAFHSLSCLWLVNYSYQIALPHACPCWTVLFFFFFFYRLLLLNYRDCFEFLSSCMLAVSLAWCSLPGQSACFLCHQPSHGWKQQLVGWVPLEDASVGSSQSVLIEQCPVPGWSSQQWWSHLQTAQASPCIPGYVMGMCHQTLSEVSEIFVSSPLPASSDILSQKEIWEIWCDLFWWAEVISCSSSPCLLSTSIELKLIIL